MQVVLATWGWAAPSPAVAVAVAAIEIPDLVASVRAATQLPRQASKSASVSLPRERR